MLIAPDKGVYYIFAQFLAPENAIKFISVRTKTQFKSLILSCELFVPYDPIVFSLQLSYVKMVYHCIADYTMVLYHEN